MQTITPLAIGDFEQNSILVVSKVEIDIDGEGNFRELPDIKTYNINTNEENRVAKLSSYSFSITCLNTDDIYNPLSSGSPYYGWLKQGRQIKLWAGIKSNGTEYPYQLILGRIDDFRLSKKGSQNICIITGRCLMRMISDFKLYSPNTHWGTNYTYDTVANQIRYDMEADCKGVYRVFLDFTSPYDGDNLEEIYENVDWTYDWHNNKLVFTSQRIPDFAGTSNLVVYYFQVQNVEDVVSDILLAAGIFVDDAARIVWLASVDCVATGETIDRVWFETGTRGIKAVTLLSEVVQYRFRLDHEGNPIFKPKPTIGSLVNTISDYETKIENVEENVEETYTHVIVIGEERDRVEGDDETAPTVPTNLALTTGFGEETQAGLAYIKATWDANTEGDFGHYELRIKKNADSDYSEVSTIATSFMFLGLEPGVTYNVQIRAVDIYENRSAWSSAEDQITATDAGTPAQIVGETGTAIVAGIKIEWTKSAEGNIAYYLVERQESPDNSDWSAGWVEISRINGDMWLDLLLTYSKYYRYRITAYTQAGVAGTTSANTSALQPSQVGTNDVAANAITAIKIDVINLAAIKADLGNITAGDITLDSNGFIRTSGKANYASNVAGLWFGYDVDKYKVNIGNANQYIRWTGTALEIKGSLVITGGSGIANLTDAGDLATLDSIAYSAITGTKPPSNADYFGGVAGDMAYEDLVELAKLGTTVITGGYIKTSLLTANNIRTGTLDTVRLNVGFGTNNDIYFKDSGIRFYDASSQKLRMDKAGYKYLSFVLLGGSSRIISESNLDLYTTSPAANILIGNITGYKVIIYNTGTLRLPALSSAPTAHQGDLSCNVPNDWFSGYISDWEHFQTTNGW